MMVQYGRMALMLIIVSLPLMVAPVCGQTMTLQQNLNGYYADFDNAFERIADATALKGTNLRSGEKLLIREMRKNMAYNTFMRTNSKGDVISEVVRGRKVERPMRNVSDQDWFKVVSRKNEPYYSMVKDKEEGRYYLFWVRPILKGDTERFVGTISARIDLWDSFYEFSNTIYEPFLIKLGRKSLFSHKWNTSLSGVEESLAIKGIQKISVLYPAPSTDRQTIGQSDTLAGVTGSRDSATEEQDQGARKKVRSGASGVLVFLFVLLIVAIAAASIMLITWMRRRAFQKSLDNDEL